MLLFQIGSDGYALPATQAIEVLPVINLKTVPQAARGIAGVFNYHGTLVPLLDLTEMAMGIPSPRLMSSRIILVRYPDNSQKDHLLGLVVDRLTGTLRAEEKDFVQSGLAIPSTLYLGHILNSPAGIVQKVELEGLLTPEVRSQLFDHAPGAE